MATEWAFPAALRYFECVVAASNTAKFWAFRVSSDDPSDVRVYALTFWWGRLGTDGQTLTKTFGTLDSAQRFAEDKVTEKLSKGYVQRDEAWVKRSLPQWRPVFAVATTRARPLLVGPPPIAKPTCIHRFEDVTTIGDSNRKFLCVKCGVQKTGGVIPAPEPTFRPVRSSPPPTMNPGRVQRSKPVLLPQPGKRVIDFTED